MEKYILRIDNKYWRVKIRIPGGAVTKQFSFAKYQDEKSALRAALRWRNQQLRKYGLMERLKYDKSPDLYKTIPKSPIIGVYLNRNTDRWNWIVQIADGKKKAFSADIYGTREAFLMACRARYKYAGKLRVVDPTLMPCKPDVPYMVVKNG